MEAARRSACLILALAALAGCGGGADERQAQACKVDRGVLPEGVEEPSDLVVPLGGAPLDAGGDCRDEFDVRGADFKHRCDIAGRPSLVSAAGHLEVAHTGITPCFFQGRSTRLSAAIRRPRMIVGRVSRGSMMSSIIALPAAM